MLSNTETLLLYKHAREADAYRYIGAEYGKRTVIR